MKSSFMVNKKTFLKWVRTSSALILFLASPHLQAQKIKKYYTSSLQPQGMLYYIRPQAPFTGAAGNIRLISDITYLSRSDSATINFSYFDKGSADITALMLPVGTATVTLPARKLYVEDHRKEWHYRYTVRIAYRDLKAFYGQQESPLISIGSGEAKKELRMSQRQWQKYANINTRIFTLINLN